MYSNVIWTEDQTMGRWICRPETSHTGRLVFLQTLHLDCLHSLAAVFYVLTYATVP